MIAALTQFKINLADQQKTVLVSGIVIIVFLLFLLSFIDKPLAVGLFFLGLLSLATVALLHGFGIKDKNIYTLFFAGIAIHLVVVLFLYATGFQPFGGGADYTLYHQTAVEIASRFSHNVFSLNGLYAEHFFPILIGIIYMFTFSAMIVGQLFVVWLAALALVLAYKVVVEVGGKQKLAFLAALAVGVYPSYLYFGSVLLKDTVVAPLVLAGMFLAIKMVKHFSWAKFLLFFIILTALINLRFYIGYALLFSFIVSWPLLSSFNLKKRILYWVVMVILLGFSSQLLGSGYYGLTNFERYLNPMQITYFREVVYGNKVAKPAQTVAVNTPEPSSTPTATAPGDNVAPTGTGQNNPQPTIAEPAPVTPTSLVSEDSGGGSNFNVSPGFSHGPISVIINSSLSFMYTLLGPFPWQINNKRQMVALAETFPWYVLILFSLYNIIVFIKKRGLGAFVHYHKYMLPLLVFGILAMGALSLFINNYGIIARIRIPMIICFVLAMTITFNNLQEWQNT